MFSFSWPLPPPPHSFADRAGRPSRSITSSSTVLRRASPSKLPFTRRTPIARCHRVRTTNYSANQRVPPTLAVAGSLQKQDHHGRRQQYRDGGGFDIDLPHQGQFHEGMEARQHSFGTFGCDLIVLKCSIAHIMIVCRWVCRRNGFEALLEANNLFLLSEVSQRFSLALLLLPLLRKNKI